MDRVTVLCVERRLSWLPIDVSTNDTFSPPSLLMSRIANVDWALMNFMQDWFPLEARDKLKANEEEANAEELELARLRLDSDTCVIM